VNYRYYASGVITSEPHGFALAFDEIERQRRNTKVRLTHRRRGMDSNLQFRDAAAPPTARPWCDAARSGR